MNWIEIDKRLDSLWKNSKDEQQFLELAAAEFEWTKRQTIQNTTHIFNRYDVPLIEIEKANTVRR